MAAETPAPSGITSSNGGGQRALGSVPNVGVSNGQATETVLPRNATTHSY